MTTVTDAELPAWYPLERVARYYDLGLWARETLPDLVDAALKEAGLA